MSTILSNHRDNTSVAVQDPCVRKKVVEDLWKCVRCYTLNALMKIETSGMDEFYDRFDGIMNRILIDKRETEEFIGGFSDFKWNSITEDEWMEFYNFCVEKHVKYMLIRVAQQNPDTFALSPDMALTEDDEILNIPGAYRACFTKEDVIALDKETEEAVEWWNTTGRQLFIDEHGIESLLAEETEGSMRFDHLVEDSKEWWKTTGRQLLINKLGKKLAETLYSDIFVEA